jgi:hypothetical protein
MPFAWEDDILDLQLRRTCLKTSGERRRLVIHERVTRRRFVTAHRDKDSQGHVVPLRPFEKRSWSSTIGCVRDWRAV